MIESHRVDAEAYQAALDFLYDRINYERQPSETARYPFRLHRTDQLLKELDLAGYLSSHASTPAVPIVHIAGTKGKGSTSAMVASALTASGYKTGVYSSPHLHRLEERFQIDGQPCSQDDLVSLVARIEPVARSVSEQANRSASFFELTTAIALLHFDTQQCDAIVLEVGLGGRLDSTNVCAPSVTAITSIGLDHQHVLGDTLAEIAKEKAGIIKAGVPVISGVHENPARDVIRSTAESKSAPLLELGRDFEVSSSPLPNWGYQVDYRGMASPLSQSSVTLSLEGAHQAHNASVALACLDVLRDQGLQIEPTAVRQGIALTNCPGRIERIQLPDNVTAIVDSAHNADSINALCECLRERAQGRQIAVVFGTSQDKQAQPMLECLLPICDQLILTRFKGNPRYTLPEELFDIVPATSRDKAKVVDEPLGACRFAVDAMAPGGIVVVCGSFFLAAETRQWLLDSAVG